MAKLTDEVNDSVVQERMQATLELFEFGEAVMRERLRQQYPDEEPAEIERRLVAWLQTRPGAEHGDASGPSFVVRRRHA